MLAHVGRDPPLRHVNILLLVPFAQTVKYFDNDFEQLVDLDDLQFLPEVAKVVLVISVPVLVIMLNEPQLSERNVWPVPKIEPQLNGRNVACSQQPRCNLLPDRVPEAMPSHRFRKRALAALQRPQLAGSWRTVQCQQVTFSDRSADCEQ